ncbi:hypothetical protein BC830DRAFT_1089498 [Chytriomyces sp. MP71]|nr:hypothetical protein BC830DRAFT_1133815 [Chytriomyces sp. MP71]KAI8617329.1 hypothetical protein BC830DRAFT_1114146 [Chytriomyces sp. MP71]KAI8622332.1 hypothetical protein BC830DRAFT_1089498 [Chytriomyces sp. MP71]
MVASPYHHHRSHSLSKKDLLLFTTNARGGGGATSSGVVGMERAATISTSVPIPHSAHLGLFACPYEPCTHTFPHLLEMRAHCFQEHSQATPHSCQTCLQTFTRRNDLLRHQKTVHHQGLTMNVCQVCKKEFARMDSLRRHERICM